MNIAKILNEYFQNQNSCLDANVSVVREDGIVLYSNLQKKFKPESIGALAAGVWQAAHALNTTIDTDNKEVIDFRLSFDKSSEGVYLLGLKHDKSNYLLCSIYNDIFNPAKLKMSIRSLKNDLEAFISNYKEQVTTNSFLFESITDADMDRLFAGGAV